MRCLDKWTAADGNTYNLVQINDYSIIPSSVISATTYADEPELIDRVSSLPNYITSTGDKFGSFDSTTINGKYFAGSEYLDVAIGKYSYNDSRPNMIGTFCRELVYQNEIFGQTGWSSLGNIVGDVYYGVIIDDTNNRAYIIELQYIANHTTYGNVWYIFVIGGKANGIDVIWQTFQPKITSNGGGATHIAKITGQLKDLSSNLSDILMVSGGGGGGLLVGDTDYSGKEAGGISGSGDNSADQSTGNAFGQGESGTNVSGGGSGLYGGYKGTSSKSGGAGSGYIANSLLSNKKMVGYNVPTSSAEGTKTESANDVSASAVSGKPKSGNGFARIKLIREVEQFRSISRPLGNRIMPAKFKPEYSYYYGRQEVPTGQQYYDIEGATPITLTRGGSDSFTFGDLPACFGIYDPNSSNVVNWYLRKTNSSGASMLINGSNTGSFSADGNYTFYIIAGGEPSNPNGKGYFTVIRTTDWSNGWGGLAFSTDVMTQLRDYFA